jgi:hypothetical protein
MGLLFGLEKQNLCLKRQFRWLLEIPGVACDDDPQVDSLPPEKSARPNYSYKEMEARHLIEDIFYPAKTDWKPIQLTLFDLVKPKNLVFDWLMKVYDPRGGKFKPPIPAPNTQPPPQPKDLFIKTCYLKQFSGCGDLLETWVFEDAWPSSINWQTLDMGNSGYLVCDITLRYARAFIEEADEEEVD